MVIINIADIKCYMSFSFHTIVRWVFTTFEVDVIETIVHRYTCFHFCKQKTPLQANIGRWFRYSIWSIFVPEFNSGCCSFSYELGEGRPEIDCCAGTQRCWVWIDNVRSTCDMRWNADIPSFLVWIAKVSRSENKCCESVQKNETIKQFSITNDQTSHISFGAKFDINIRNIYNKYHMDKRPFEHTLRQETFLDWAVTHERPNYPNAQHPHHSECPDNRENIRSLDSDEAQTRFARLSRAFTNAKLVILWNTVLVSAVALRQLDGAIIYV